MSGIDTHSAETTNPGNPLLLQLYRERLHQARALAAAQASTTNGNGHDTTTSEQSNDRDHPQISTRVATSTEPYDAIYHSFKAPQTPSLAKRRKAKHAHRDETTVQNTSASPLEPSADRRSIGASDTLSSGHSRMAKQVQWADPISVLITNATASDLTTAHGSTKRPRLSSSRKRTKSDSAVRIKAKPVQGSASGDEEEDKEETDTDSESTVTPLLLSWSGLQTVASAF